MIQFLYSKSSYQHHIYGLGHASGKSGASLHAKSAVIKIFTMKRLELEVFTVSSIYSNKIYIRLRFILVVYLHHA